VCVCVWMCWWNWTLNVGVYILNVFLSIVRVCDRRTCLCLNYDIRMTIWMGVFQLCVIISVCVLIIACWCLNRFVICCVFSIWTFKLIWLSDLHACDFVSIFLFDCICCSCVWYCNASDCISSACLHVCIWYCVFVRVWLRVCKLQFIPARLWLSWRFYLCI
jgi:hypothetical protein